MCKKMTPREFVRKCEYEGGGLYEGFAYGLRVDDLDNSDPEFNHHVALFQLHYLAADAADNKFNEYVKYAGLSQYENEEDEASVLESEYESNYLKSKM